MQPQPTIRLSLPSEAERVARSGEGRDGRLRDPNEPRLVVSEEAGERATGMEVEALIGLGGDGGVLLPNGVAELFDVQPVDRTGHVGDSPDWLCHVGNAC